MIHQNSEGTKLILLKYRVHKTHILNQPNRGVTMENEEYSLIWNEFNSSTSETFKNLLLDEDFVDVTLICDDARQFHAHKVILSACSPFFRNLFVKNPHPKPLIFLKGIRFEELETILKFMYLGQAQLPQEDLSAFLDAAKELQVKGLNCDDDSGKLHTNNKRKRGVIDEPSSKKVCDLQQDVPEETPFAAIPITPDIGTTENPMDSIFPLEIKQESSEPDIGHTTPTQIRKMYYCDKCDYSASKSTSVKYHHQTVHEGLRYDCDQCDAFFTRKESLKTHKLSLHEGIRFPCDQCEYKATESGALKKHKQSQHENVDYWCHLCDHGAKSEKKLKQHMISKHMSQSEILQTFGGHEDSNPEIGYTSNPSLEYSSSSST